MSTISQFFQPPLYWQQFEELAVGMLREVYDVPNAQAYGRSGQAQNGVDVYGKSRYGMIGIQCKRLADRDENGNPYPGGPISRSFLRAAAAASLAFRPNLEIWILATTARRDTHVQGYVDDLNQEWEERKRGRRAIVWSWDECISYLNSFPELQRWYYRDVIQIRGTKDLDEVILRTIAMAFSRPAFELPLHCETPDEFEQALKDTQKALRTGELVDRESRHVIRKAVGGYHEIDDDDCRAALGRVDKQLRQVRSQLGQGLKDESIRRVNGFLDFSHPALSLHLEDLRSQCVQDLNQVLRKAGIPPI
ncbi:MAG: hypothetical protein EOR05_19855 [Mesorhizobium sp.]|nr:MAG: hypothetical protein EOR05_19855 [Mesorhizobium sp.]